VPRIALTATADRRPREDIIERLRLAMRGCSASFDRPNIRYAIVAEGPAAQQLLPSQAAPHPAKAASSIA
jgi:ATP-dependent DNA helicase RecQ